MTQSLVQNGFSDGRRRRPRPRRLRDDGPLYRRLLGLRCVDDEMDATETEENDVDRGVEGTLKFTSWSSRSIGRFKIVGWSKEGRAGGLNVESATLSLFSTWCLPPKSTRSRSCAECHSRSSSIGDQACFVWEFGSIPGTSEEACDLDWSQFLHNVRPSPCTTLRRADSLRHDGRNIDTQRRCVAPSLSMGT